MLKAKWLAAGAYAVLASGYYLAIAQDPPAGGQPPPPPSQNPPATERRTEVRTQTEGVQVPGQVPSDRTSARPMAFHRAKQILGSKVGIESGLSIGTVEDIVFSDDGMIEYMVVANESKLVSVPWAAAKFNFDQRMATVAISQEKFQQIPTYTENNWPRFQDPQYRTQTYKNYGLTPGQARRAVRRGAVR